MAELSSFLANLGMYWTLFVEVIVFVSTRTYSFLIHWWYLVLIIIALFLFMFRWTRYLIKKKKIKPKNMFVVLWLTFKFPVVYLFKGISFVFRNIYFGILYFVKKSKERRAKQEKEFEEAESDLFDDDFDDAKVEKPAEPKVRREKVKRFKVVETLQGTLLKFENLLKNNKSSIGIILGARGQGKSALGMRILENVHYQTGKRCVAMGFEAKHLPKWIHVVDDVENLPSNSVVLIDEGGILFSSRDAMSSANKMLSSLLLVARHKDLSVIFISQNSSNLELNAIRQADYILLKPSSLLQRDFERKKIKNLYEEVSDKFDQYKNTLGITYVYSDVYRGFVTNDLPGFWSDNVSKAFKKK